MTLILEIEHLLGVAFAANAPAEETPDWPPQPDRVFSALVASWGARGERPDERRALEWLETQEPPQLAASGGFPRSAPVVFVPPNDDEGGRSGSPTVMPSMRRRQPRRFPAFRPDDAIVSMIWPQAAAEPDMLARLNALAADVAYVGHSASLSRCRFYDRDAPATAAAPRRRVYPGRLAELERGFRATPLRRPSPGEPLQPPAQEDPVPGSLFSDRWLVLEHVGEFMPDLRAAAVVAKELRQTIMSGYAKAGKGDAIPPEISGHAPDGRPWSEPHLAIVPMAFLGRPHASGAVYGFALVPPDGVSLVKDAGFRNALGAAGKWKDDAARLELHLTKSEITLTAAAEAPQQSLNPAPYVATARVWASCTPIVLDRHLKQTGNQAREDEIVALVRQACRNIGLPEPCRVAAGKHSTFEGAPSAYPSGPAPRWMRWRLPDSLQSRQLTHAVLEFAEPVRGPVILGAGRFVGLGLCRALDRERRG